MRKVSPGLVCIVLGVVLLLAAGGLYAYNRYEDAHAGAEAQTVVADLQQKVVQQKVETPEPEAESGPLDPELPVVEIDGNEYVGEISIPAIGIDLPVMSEWSYPRLKIAPCRQFGSSRTDDLVIAAHNYESHFGKLTSLTAGDNVTFTDMDGIVNEYVVNKVEVLDPHSVEEVEQPVLTSTTDEEDVVTVTDEETGALTPEGNLTLVDDYHTDYSDGSGQQFITLVSKSGATFYLVIDRNAKGQQTVHFMNLVDEADLLSLMEEEEANAYTAEKEAAAQAEQDRLKAEEEAKKAAEEAAASGTEQPKENKVTKIASGFLGVVVLIALAAGGGFYVFAKQKQKKQAEKEALDPDADYTEDKGDFEIPMEDEPEEPGEEDMAEE